MPQIKILCFLSRTSGLDCLLELCQRKYNIIGVFVPETINYEVPREYELFLSLCTRYGIPFNDNNVLSGEWDYIISVNWRKIIPESVFLKSNIVSINIHRGKLPNYMGGRPILQALEAGDNEIVITAHHITKDLDSGKTIKEAVIPIKLYDQEDIFDAERRIREQILPYYRKVMMEAILDGE